MRHAHGNKQQEHQQLREDPSHCRGLLSLNLIHWIKFSALRTCLEAHSAHATHAAHVWHTASAFRLWHVDNEAFGGEKKRSD